MQYDKGDHEAMAEAGRRQARELDLANGRVDMSHGAGGRAMADLVDLLFRPAFDNPMLNRADDQASFDVDSGRMVMTTDSFVISPLFFPGGNIGSLAVHGTVNDLAMGGAVPMYLTAGFRLRLSRLTGRTGAHRRVNGGRRPGRRGSHCHWRYQGGGAWQGRRRLHQHRRCWPGTGRA